MENDQRTPADDVTDAMLMAGAEVADTVGCENGALIVLALIEGPNGTVHAAAAAGHLEDDPGEGAIDNPATLLRAIAWHVAHLQQTTGVDIIRIVPVPGEPPQG